MDYKGNVYEYYQKKGYVCIESFFEKNRIETLKNVIAEIASVNSNYCVYDKSVISGEKILHKLYSPIYLDNQVAAILGLEKIQAVIEELWLDKTLLLTDKVNYKLPGGKGYVPHQDMQGHFKKYVDNVITAFISLDNSNKRNGCLEIAEGRHMEGLFGDKDRSISEGYLKDIKFKKITQKVGDIVFFDGFTPHKSDANYSAETRTCFVLTFNKESLGSFRHFFIGEANSFNFC